MTVGNRPQSDIVKIRIPKEHYGAFDLAKMIVAGEKLPDITKEAIDRECHSSKRERSFKQHEESYRIGSYLKGENRGLITHDGIELDRTHTLFFIVPLITA